MLPVRAMNAASKMSVYSCLLGLSKSCDGLSSSWTVHVFACNTHSADESSKLASAKPYFTVIGKIESALRLFAGEI